VGPAGRGTAEVPTDSPRPARERCWLPSKNESHDPGGTYAKGFFYRLVGHKEIQNLLESVRPGPPVVLTPEVLSKEYYRQGLDSYINGNHRKAKKLFRRSLKADPGNKEAQRGLERLANEGKKKKLAEQGAEPDAGTGRKLTP
jgi:hypothetical protein